jgi:hypothetical protein
MVKVDIDMHFDRICNQSMPDKKTNNVQQNTTQKTKEWATLTPIKNRV